MPFCTNCGAQNQDAAQFCTGCGSTLTAAQAVAAGQPSGPPALSPPGPPATSYSLPGPPLPSGVTYAQWGDRVVGYIIVSLIVGAVMGVLYLALGSIMVAAAGSSASGAICCVMIALFPVSTLLVGLYNRVYLVAQRGSSIGQGIMHLKVVDINGNLLTMGTATIRLLAQVGLSFLPMVGPLLDLLWPLWDERRQTLHDKAVSSFVLKMP